MNNKIKREASTVLEEPSRKRIKALLEDDTSEDDGASSENSDAAETNLGLPGGWDGFKINEEFARRFEHNKKREELHKCTWAYTVIGRSISDSSSAGEIRTVYYIYEFE